MHDTEEALILNEPSSALLNAIADGRNPIACNWLSTLGYPFQYRVNEAHLGRSGYHYNIAHDAWFLNPQDVTP